jgi:hypothetical protein
MSLNVTEKMTDCADSDDGKLAAAILAAKNLGSGSGSGKSKNKDKKHDYPPDFSLDLDLPPNLSGNLSSSGYPNIPPYYSQDFSQPPPYFPGSSQQPPYYPGSSQQPPYYPGNQSTTLMFPNTPPDTNPVSDYYNWLAFWNTVASSNDPNAMFQSSNYISKTAVVPPVCPNCPQCSAGAHGGGVCTGCGGKGGSGTSSAYKNRFSDFLAAYGAGYKGNGKWESGYGGVSKGSGPGLGRLAEEAGSGAVDLTKTVLKDTTGLLRDTGSGATGLLRDTGAGATDLLRDTGSGALRVGEGVGSGAVGLLKDTGAGVKDLLEDAGSGVKDILKSNPVDVSNKPGSDNKGQNGTAAQPNNPYQSGYYSAGSYNLPNNPLGIQGIDPYSYNGALVSKGSNYIPVTDDFSAFRK